MSYILDALRKADAERERGAVPGIHDQTMFAGVPQFGERGAGRPWWIWLLVALALVLLLVVAVLVWNMRGAQPSRSMADATASGRVSAALPAPTAAVPLATPASAAATTPVPAAAPPVEAAKPVPPRKARVANPTASANAGGVANAGAGAVSKANAEPLPKSNASAAPPPAAASAPAPAVTVTRIYQLGELPEEIRRQVPEITVGGSMYSNVPANRILIINGTVFHEGDKLTPDLVLQQIRLKAAVLSFKDYRYLISF